MTTSAPEHEIPADLRLRSKRPPVVRLSRKVLIGAGSVSAVALLGVVAYAMTAQRSLKVGPELYNVGGGPPEQVRTLPADYRSAPRLGPPLPGDLGGPILAAGAPAPVIGPGEPLPAAPPDTALEAAKQRQVQERDAARTSRLFASDAQSSSSTPLLTMAAGDVATLSPGQPGEAGTLEGPVDRRTTSVERLAAPASPYVVQAGAVIPAALVTGIRSDLPGQVVGQVTQNVYDTPTGRILLIPQGARLLGVYENRIAFGQRRVLLAWTRLLLPDGRSLVLEKLPAGDAAGYAGLEDQVDGHWSGLLGMAALSTLLGVGTELGSSDDDSEVLKALRTGAAGTFNQVGQQAVGKGLSVAPTLTIRPGAPVRVIVTRDLVLQPYRS
ncbi:TrbI/VirB10 family protein [Phenylobacterium sp.]|uniref:TrbI/VirB10 family protein n=1 Tax=Phenylobacterium sp. TaxID=1871053 RepID=UPI002FC61224